MDAGRQKRKRSELELLIGNSDAGALSTFSPRPPAPSASSPVLVETTAESDEQLARRLHEELNGTRMTRRGSKAVTEDGVSLSPVARGMTSPHAKSKAETPRAHGGPGRPSLPLLPAISDSVPGSADAEPSTAAEGRAVEGCSRGAGAIGSRSGSGTGGGGAGEEIRAGAETGAGAGAGSAPVSGTSAEGGGEAVKRKRNSVPARELHLLLQQASFAAGRAETTLSPTRSARAGTLANARADQFAASNDSHQHASSHQQGSQFLQPRDSGRSNSQQGQQHQHQPTGSAASAPALPSPSPGAPPPPSPRAPPPPPSPRGPLPPPPPPSILPPKLKQRYLAGLTTMNRLPAPVAASESNGGRGPEEIVATGGGTVAAAGNTAVTPNCVLGGARNSLLSGQSLEGNSVVSHSHSQSPSRGRNASSAGAAYTPSEAAGASGRSEAAASAASLAGAGPRSMVANGASIGGCSSTDETENDNDNSCAAAVAGAGDRGPSATSPKAPLAPPLPPPPLPPMSGAAQKQRSGQASGQTTESDLADDDTQLKTQGRPQRQPALVSTGTTAQPLSGQAKQTQSLGYLLAAHSKVPKLPMIRAGRGWYRGRLMRESADGQRVLVDVPGAPNPGNSGSSSGHSSQNQPFWLPVSSDRIWRGSYKGKDWKYLGDGAWEPKPAAFKRGKQGSSVNGLQLPLPPWAVDRAGAGSEVDAQVLPTTSTGIAGVGAMATGQRSKADRGDWSSPDETSDDGEAAEEPQQMIVEGPSTRSGQRSKRRNSPAAAASGLATVDSAKAVQAATKAAAVAGEAKRRFSATSGEDCAPAAATADVDAASTEPQGEVTTDRCVEAEQPANKVALSETAKIAVIVAAAEADMTVTAGVAELAATLGKDPAPHTDDVSMDSPEASASADMEAAAGAAAAISGSTKAEPEEDGGDGGAAGEVLPSNHDDYDAGEITWAPGITYPQKHMPRRAQRRQQRVRTPFDGWQLSLPHHQSLHNPYAFYPCLSDESGRDGDASDAEHAGGRRGSGDGATAAMHHGSRRRAAARAAAVAAAAARAEAEAEEEEQEEILMGRRPSRRDRVHPQHSGAPVSRRNHHSHHHRSRSGVRADYYLYGDSSGNLDDPYSGDGMLHGHGSSARPRVSSRGNSQPAPEYGSGGSGAWETVPWQTAGMTAMDGASGPAPTAAPTQPRNRRKGKPSRSRMDGEGDAWCCGEDEWELEARGGAWARMPEVLRRLYYTPCPATAVNEDNGGCDGGPSAQQQDADTGRVLLHRQSGGGAYFGALQAPNKRRRAYEEDPMVSPDDLDLDVEMEIDDHEHDADYLPPYGVAGGSRRTSGFGGGRRCSANGGPTGIAKRQRSTDAPFLQHHQQTMDMYQLHHPGQYGEATMAVQAKRRIVVTCGPLARAWGSMCGGGGAVTASGDMALVGAGGVLGASSDVGYGIPAGLAGLLEAALGQNTAPGSPALEGADDVEITQGTVTDVKMESEPMPDAAGRLEATCIDGGMAVELHRQGAPLPALAPGDPHGAHVALSDSSAAPSGPEESIVVAAAATITAVDASGPSGCADGSSVAVALLRQQRVGNSSGGGGFAGFGAGSGSPPQPGIHIGQLRPNTPTRAKRTGRPPFAVLGANAPLPKLPALSTVPPSMLTGGMAGPVTVASSTDGSAASGGRSVNAAAATEAVTAAHLPASESMDEDARGLADTAVPARPAEVTVLRPTCPNIVVSVAGDHAEEMKQSGGRDHFSGCKLWQTGGGDGGSGIGSANAGAVLRAGAGYHAAGSLMRNPTATADTAAVASDADGYGVVEQLGTNKQYNGADVTGCCVMDAIEALKYDKQPAMQQLAMRAQLELDNIGLMLSAQHPQTYGVVQQQDEQQLQRTQYVTQQLLQMLPGRCNSNGRIGGMVRSGSLSAAASPPAPDPLISSLPSVEVVVSLFSSRASYGSAQQALSELVGAASALPLFRCDFEGRSNGR